MRRFFDILSRVLAALLAAYVLTFGFIGFSVAAMAGVEFKIATAIAMSATQSQGMFLLWLSSGLLGFACFAFAVRPKGY